MPSTSILDQSADTILKLRNLGLPYTTIAQRLNTSKASVCRAVRRLGVPKQFDKHKPIPAERRSEVAALWSAGWNSREIGDRFNVTANSISGLVHRMGLSRVPNGSDRKLENEHKSQQTRHRHRTKHQGRNAPPKNYLYPQTIWLAGHLYHDPDGICDLEIKSHDPQPEERVSLGDLKANQCHWPYGEGLDTTFCGNPKHGSGSYCEAHSRRACKPFVPYEFK